MPVNSGLSNVYGCYEITSIEKFDNNFRHLTTKTIMYPSGNKLRHFTMKKTVCYTGNNFRDFTLRYHRSN